MNLVTPNQSKLFGFIYALVRNNADAHDIYQQTVLALWNKYDQFESGTNFVAWAMRTAQYECLRFRRQQHRNRLEFSDTLTSQLADIYSAESPSSDVQIDRFEALVQCLDRLSNADYQLIEQCYYRSQKIQDIAKRLERSSQSICNSLRRIRESLFKCIEQRLVRGGTV